MSANKARIARAARRVLALLVLTVGSLAMAAAQANINFNDVQADQLFRQGVARFNDGYHAEATVLFQKALGLQPGNYLARVWLGRAYYYAGSESAAIQEWKNVQANGKGSPVLTAFLESLQARRGLSRDVREDFDFFPVKELDRKGAKPNEFRRPAAVLTLSDGTSYVASFGNNAIVRLDANGRTRDSLRGGFTHFAGPFDMALVQGKRLFVTQMLGDQVYEITLDGQVVKTFGGSGSGNGQFKGPQYLAWDGANALFVSDFGNRRINKFDLDGNYVMSFGGHAADFAGLERPTGLLFADGVLYVGDASRKNPCIYRFDVDGNALGSINDDRLADIESIKPYENGHMLVTTRTAVYGLDPADQVLTPLFSDDKNPHARYTSSTMDANGNIVASDFDGERMAWLSRIAGIYSGLHVEISRVVAERFPEVWVECQVLDNLGNPVVGLDLGNFTVTEGRKSLRDVKLVASGFRQQSFSTVLLVQADQAMASDYNREAATNAVGAVVDSLGGGSTYSLLSCGRQSTVEAPPGSGKQVLQAAVQNVPRDDFWYLDLGLRNAVPQLVKSPGLREVVFVGQGGLPEDAFARYGLDENVNFLRNNRVRFSVVQVEDRPLDPGLAQLVAQTGGSVYYLYNPKGLAGLGPELLRQKDGSYAFRFNSLFDSDFGRKYLPVEIEARLFQKSGRDESGYFAPLQH